MEPVKMVAEMAANELGREGGKVEGAEKEGGDAERHAAVDGEKEHDVFAKATKTVLQEDIRKRKADKGPRFLISHARVREAEGVRLLLLLFGQQIDGFISNTDCVGGRLSFL